MISKKLKFLAMLFLIFLSIPFLVGWKNKIARMGLKGKIAYETGGKAVGCGKAIGILDLETGKHRKINVGEMAYDPELSPDGKKIAYVTINFLKIFNMETKTKKSFWNMETVRRPKWSPDGKKLLYDSNRLGIGGPDGVFIIDVRTEKEELISETISNASWTTDGRGIIFSTNEQGICVMDLSTKRITPLPYPVKPAWSSRFSPDGSKIVYRAEMEGSSYEDIFIVDKNGKNRKKLTNSPYRKRSTLLVHLYDCSAPRWTPDGKKILYQKWLSGGYFPLFYSASYLYMMNPDGTNKVKIKKFWF